MKLQGFLFKNVKVRGPMGVYEEERAFPTGSTSISHNGRTFEADASGWADVTPDTEAQKLKALSFRHPLGGRIRYCSPDEVDEKLRLGLVEQGSVRGPVVEPVRRGPGRPRKDADEE